MVYPENRQRRQRRRRRKIANDGIFVLVACLILAIPHSHSMCIASVQLKLEAVRWPACSSTATVISNSSCPSANASSAIATRVYLQPHNSSLADTCAFSPSVPTTSASGLTSGAIDQPLLVPCVTASSNVSACFVVTCCAGLGNSSVPPHIELCINLGDVLLDNQSERQAVFRQNGQASLSVGVRVSRGRTPAAVCTRASSTGSSPLCQNLTYLTDCPVTLSCVNCTAPTRGPGPEQQDDDSGIGIDVIIGLVVTFSALIGLAGLAFCLFKAGCFHRSDTSKAYSSDTPTVVIRDVDTHTMTSNISVGGQAEIRALQDLTFGRMSPEWSPRVPVRHLGVSTPPDRDEEVDAYLPLPPLNYCNIIGLGSHGSWLDCVDGEVSRNSVVSTARRDQARSDPIQATLHANTLAISLNELDSRVSDGSSDDDGDDLEGKYDAAFGTSV